MFKFKRASKEQAKLRMALMGPSGAGKTFSALQIGSFLGERVAVIDTEHGSASKYADKFEFDVVELQSFHPSLYIEAIQAANSADYDVLIIDSLSHAWMGKDGVLDLKDKAEKRSINSFTAWREITPLQNQLIDSIIGSSCHTICTFRTKQEYVIETDDRGKARPRKVGLAPIQRDSVEYEFDICGELDLDNNLVISKTRCPELAGAVINKPGEAVAEILKNWLTDGVEPAPKINRDAIISHTTNLMSSLGWSAEDGVNYLQDAYGKKSRQLLTDEELLSFENALKTLKVN